MGDPSIDVTEENRDASQEAKSKAMEAMSEGALFSPHPFGLFFSFSTWLAFNLIPHYMWHCLSGKLEEAIDHLTKAILLNPLSAIMYGTRGRSPLNALYHPSLPYIMHKH